MKRKNEIMRAAIALFAAALFLAACGSQGSGDNADAPNSPAPTASREKPKLAPCPFKKTHDWKAFTEAGSLKVIGEVDLMMAGFKPALTFRSSQGGILALDLALASDPGAAVSSQVRYQQAGSGVNRVDIRCGGQSIQSVSVIHVG